MASTVPALSGVQSPGPDELHQYAALLDSLVALPSAAESNHFGGEDNILLGNRVAQPTVARDDLTPPNEVPSAYRTECGSRKDPARPPSTLWFRRTHGAVKMYFVYTRVRSPANCAACHPRAERWNYAPNEVRMPRVSLR